MRLIHRGDRGAAVRDIQRRLLAANVVMVAFLWWVAGDTQRWIEMGAWSRAQWMTLKLARLKLLGGQQPILDRLEQLIGAAEL